MAATMSQLVLPENSRITINSFLSQIFGQLRDLPAAAAVKFCDIWRFVKHHFISNTRFD